MGFAALFVLTMLIFFALLAGVFWGVRHGKIGLTSGRLTYSPFMRVLSFVYPVILLVALIAYYVLPFDHLYQADEDAYSTYPHEKMLWLYREAFFERLLEEDIGILTDSNLNWETAKLPFEQTELDITVRHCNEGVYVSKIPSETSTIVLHYFPGQLAVGGYRVDGFIQPHVADFILTDNGTTLLVKDFPADAHEKEILPFTLWGDPALADQFPLDTFDDDGNVDIADDALPLLIVQVPEGTTVTNYGEPVARGTLY